MVRVARAIDASVPAACPAGTQSPWQAACQGSPEFLVRILQMPPRRPEQRSGGQGMQMFYQAYEAFEA